MAKQVHLTGEDFPVNQPYETLFLKRNEIGKKEIGSTDGVSVTTL